MPLRPSRWLPLLLVALLASAAAAQQTAPAPRTQPTKVTFREDKTILVNGEPFFPLGLYYVEDERADESGRMLRELRELGFNTIFYYGEPDKAVLDRIAAAGLMVQYGPPGGIYSEYDRLRETVAAVREHPALLLWHMVDEPVLNKVELEQAKAGYELMKTLDPDHPVSLNQWPSPRHITPEQIVEWASACDIYGFDFYPIPLKRWERWGGELKDPRDYSIAIMGRLMQQWQELVPDKPFIVVLQAWSWDPLEYSEEGYPTPQESRFMAFHSVIHGAKGINYYGKRSVSAPHTANSLPPEIDPDPEKARQDFEKAKELNAAFWEDFEPVVKELSELLPVFAAPDAEWTPTVTLLRPAGQGEQSGDAADAPQLVETRVKLVGQTPVLLVVNASAETVHPELHAPALAKATLHSWLDGRTLRTDDNGNFSEGLEPWAVRVYAPAERAEVLGDAAAQRAR